MNRTRLLLSFTVIILSAAGLLGSEAWLTPIQNTFLVTVFIVAAYNLGRALTGGER